MTVYRLREAFHRGRPTQHIRARFLCAGVPNHALTHDHPNPTHILPRTLWIEKREIAWFRQQPIRACFNAPMPRLNGMRMRMRHPLPLVISHIAKRIHNICIQRLLILLDRQDIVPPVVDNLAGDGFLTPHGVNSDGTARQIQELQECGDRGHLIRFGIDRPVRQDQPTLLRPYTD